MDLSELRYEPAARHGMMHTDMKIQSISFPLAMPVIFCAALGYAAEGVQLKPVLTNPGKLIFEDNFSSGSLAKPWTVAKGDWQAKNGVVTGKEKPEDKHN